MKKHSKFIFKSVLILICSIFSLTIFSSCRYDWAMKISSRKNVRWCSIGEPVFEFTIDEYNAFGHGFMDVDDERIDIWFFWAAVRQSFIVYKGETIVFDENGTQLGEGEIIFRGGYEKKGKNVRLTLGEDEPWHGKYSEIILKGEDI